MNLWIDLYSFDILTKSNLPIFEIFPFICVFFKFFNFALTFNLYAKLQVI